MYGTDNNTRRYYGIKRYREFSKRVTISIIIVPGILGWNNICYNVRTEINGFPKKKKKKGKRVIFCYPSKFALGLLLFVPAYASVKIQKIKKIVKIFQTKRRLACVNLKLNTRTVHSVHAHALSVLIGHGQGRCLGRGPGPCSSKTFYILIIDGTRCRHSVNLE